MATPPKLAIVGTGRMGGIRANILLDHPDLFNVKYIVEANQETGERMAARFPDCKYSPTLSDIIDDVDAVHIATSTTVHPEHIQEALLAGKPTFTEKPVALTKKDIQECYRIAEQEEVPLMVGFQRRHAQPFVAAKSAIPLDEICNCHLVNRDNPMPDPKILHLLGGIWDDFAVHDIDMALYVMEEKPIAVGAYGFATYGGSDPSAYDNCSFVLLFSRGRSVTVTASRFSSSEYDQRLEILGQNKTVKADMGAEYSFGECYADAYTQELKDFSGMVAAYMAGNREVKPVRPYQHCLWIADIVDALKESAEHGGVMVQVARDAPGVGVSIVGRGDFSTYTQGLLADRARSKVATKRVHHTGYKYEPVEDSDFVYVCTPDSTHATIVNQALDSNKHVLCEKPGFFSLSAYRDAAAKARRRGLIAHINFQRRHDRMYLEARDAVHNARGDVVKVALEARDPVPHEPGMFSLSLSLSLSLFLSLSLSILCSHRPLRLLCPCRCQDSHA
eukprot:TRINITY_DN1905_c0_g1_i1.p1 TRINITY_DN1905_c0_g1~~TRINITY_DN1905_c0_g1_i1.p1  ORF type:complete len:513 (-),score=101.71 TRINITY_DN1905_c0_g1_i1:363-1874(-)